MLWYIAWSSKGAGRNVKMLRNFDKGNLNDISSLLMDLPDLPLPSRQNNLKFHLEVVASDITPIIFLWGHSSRLGWISGFVLNIVDSGPSSSNIAASPTFPQALFDAFFTTTIYRSFYDRASCVAFHRISFSPRLLIYSMAVIWMFKCAIPFVQDWDSLDTSISILFFSDHHQWLTNVSGWSDCRNICSAVG